MRINLSIFTVFVGLALAAGPAWSHQDPAGEEIGDGEEAASDPTVGQPAPPSELNEWKPEEAAPAPTDAETIFAVAVEGAKGCAVIGGPLAACGMTTGAIGVTSILAIFTAGLPTQLGLCGFALGTCVGVPALFATGPCSIAGIGWGAAKASPRDVEFWRSPAFIAGVPAVALTLLGSAAAFIGTTMFIVSFLGQDGADMRAAGALMSAGALTNALVPPATILGVMTLEAAMGMPEEASVASSQESVAESEDAAVLKPAPTSLAVRF